MLVIIGMILLLTWIFDHAFHLTADSLVNLLLVFASISFALDFFRDREAIEPRPGWDDRPPRLSIDSLARWVRHRLDPSAPIAPAEKSTADGEGR